MCESFGPAELAARPCFQFLHLGPNSAYAPFRVATPLVPGERPGFPQNRPKPALTASDSQRLERDRAGLQGNRSAGMDALFVSADGFLLTHSEQIVTLASWTAVPASVADVSTQLRRLRLRWHGLRLGTLRLCRLGGIGGR